MESKRLRIGLILVLLVVMAACAPKQANDVMMEKPTDAMMEEPTDAMMEKPTEVMAEKPTDEMMEEKPEEEMAVETATPDGMMEPTSDGEMMATPVWLSATLTNVKTDESFKVAEYKDKVVLVELMAQWCTTCKQQQMQIKTLYAEMAAMASNEDLVIVALDIDPNEDAATLKTYAADNGFDWIYAISPADVSREIGNLYGAQYLNPPSAPMLIIDRKGEVHPLPFGVKSADDLKKAIDPFLNEM